jgi:hypothetical protein
VKWLLYTNVFIALAAAILSGGSFRLIGAEPDPWFCAWVFGATMLVYTAQRLMKLRTYTLSTEMMSWVAAHRRSLTISAAASLVLTFLIALKLPLDLLLNAWPMALVSLLYALPFFPIKGERRALREWPHVKLYLIAGVWTYITLWMPMRLSSTVIGTWEMALLAERFTFIMAITIPFDIRDEELDSPKLHTLPQLMGAQQATLLAMALLTFGIGVFILGLKEDLIIMRTMLWTSAVYALAFALVYLGRKPRAYWFYLALLDGLMLLLGVIWLLT